MIPCLISSLAFSPYFTRIGSDHQNRQATQGKEYLFRNYASCFRLRILFAVAFDNRISFELVALGLALSMLHGALELHSLRPL